MNCGVSKKKAPQCWQELANTSRFAAGFGCSGRCAPACGLRRFPSGVLLSSTETLFPWLGGVLEFSGVFGGRLSLARSAALSACSLALSARSASTSLVKHSIASTCERMRRISVSLSSESSVSRFIHSLNQLAIPLSNLPRDAKSRQFQLLGREQLRIWLSTNRGQVESGDPSDKTRGWGASRQVDCVLAGVRGDRALDRRPEGRGTRARQTWGGAHHARRARGGHGAY